MIDFGIICKEYLQAAGSAPASTTLNGAITASDLAITLASGAALSAIDGPIIIKIDSELIIGTRSSNTVTVDGDATANLRGAFVTTAASHSSGATVSAATLYDVVSTRVYADKMPKDWANATPTLLFGILNPQHEFRIPAASLDLELYGFTGTDNPAECHALGRLLADRLHGVNMFDTTSGTILSAAIIDGPTLVQEEDTEYKRAMCLARLKLRSR